MDFTTNYCGPYWSDGKFQSSVASGKPPVSQLDAACQLHDRAYATAKTQHDLVVADNKFFEQTRNLGIRGPIYGSIVKYGNQALRDPMAFFLPFLGLAGYSAASTAALSTALPKKNRLRQPDIVGDSDEAPTMVYDPTPELTCDAPEVVGEPTHVVPLYKPLGRKRLKRKKLAQKNTVLPHPQESKNKNNKENTHKNTSPENKTLNKIIKLFSNKIRDDRKQITKKKHVDQEKCTHPDIRACYNYKYCARCDREFHQGKHANH